ncbi:MAG: amino acid permease [Desulforhopalus sp.]
MASPSEQRNTPQSTNKGQEDSGKLGTFAGVFTPSILTILGIILFLRLGYVTGSGGVGRVLIIIAIANVITILTSQSLAAIATNLKVKGGGDYYLISRTLGMEFGGAIGIVLYLAQSISVAFYCIGFAEALTALLGPDFFLSSRLIAVVAVGCIFMLAWLGADWATKFQYLVMGLLVAALLSFFVGGLPQWQSEMFIANWSPDGVPQPFWIIFAIFFPAVTGFTQGVSMSGDLRDPGKSLPLGTFMAVGISILVYFAVVIVFAGVLPNRVLVEDYQAIKQVARYDFLIDAGVIAATLSSAMASFLGGPRILQSLAADKIFPLLTPFAKGSGLTNNPRRAVMLTCGVALLVIMLGQLNLVARIVSMFFLISYGLLNYATWYEAHTESPSFRPRFRWFNKYLSLLGSLVCLVVIFALDLKYGLEAIAILAIIYLYVKRKAGPARWADSGRSHAMQVIRRQLLATFGEPEHDRDWRPHILVFTRDSGRRPLLLQFAHWIGGTTGLISAIKIIDGTGLPARQEKETALTELNTSIQEAGLKIFPVVVSGQDITEVIETLLQGYGVGPLKGNTVLCNWYGETMTSFPGLSAMKFGSTLRVAFHSGYNLVVFHGDPLRTDQLFDTEKKERIVDVWWNNDASSRLMLLLAYLMTRSDLWANATLRLLTVGEPRDLTETIQQLEQQLDDARIPAQPLLIPDMKPETVIEQSSESDLVFMPFRIKQSMLTDTSGLSLERVLTRLPPVALVMAARDIDLDAEPEEGAAGQLAEAMDSMQEMEKRLAIAREEHQKNEEHLLRLREQLEALTESDDEAGREKLTKQLPEAEAEVKQSSRKMMREQAKFDGKSALVRELSNNSHPSP